MTEIWRPIEGHPGYEVSDHGRVRSFKRKCGLHSWEIADTPQRILSPASSGKYPYPQVQLCNNGISHAKKVHTLVAEAFLGPRPDGMYVRHLDDDATNNVPGNLEYGTQADNMQDAIRNAGDDAFYINERKRKRVRRLYATTDLSATEIAERCGISSKSVYDICADMPKNGRGAPKKITDAQVQRMRELRAGGWLLEELAQKFGVDQSHVSLVCRGLRRPDVGGPISENGKGRVS